MLEACFFGRDQPYLSTLSLMHALHEQVAQRKICEQLMLLEHEPVITFTRQHLLKSIITSEARIKDDGIAVALADRGGDATFHGPGQLVGYPLIRISRGKGVDLGLYIRTLESALLQAVQSFGVRNATLLPGFTGIWVKCREERRIELKKLVAIGVGVKDGVSKHGFAFNVDIDWRRYTEHLVPCGLKDQSVITLSELFYQESLEMPKFLAMVSAISECLCEAFSLTLKWRCNGLSI
ncbi:MAG TPA: lipoyl(octanoyl) transferase LipB [Myxococcota bacterium]|nr:lipoyl(octanoyl) transferase LipB [Myxococcota bacterium]